MTRHPFESRGPLSASLPADMRAARVDELPLIDAIDEDAGSLYAEHGMVFELSYHHPFVSAERARWAAAIADGRLWLSLDARGAAVGFIACSTLDDAPYVEQLSVRRRHMRRGLGRRLLALAFAWSAPHDLWLTTYGHLPWNGPYYRRHGFEPVEERAVGDELWRVLARQRTCLPLPEQRVAMRRRATQTEATIAAGAVRSDTVRPSR
jgi:GNAT superfamily N-acetyltransferase